MLIKNLKKTENREAIFGITDRGWMIRDDRFKYCVYNNGIQLLHDLKNDPLEQVNLSTSKAHESIKNDMRKLMDKRIFDGFNEANKDQKVVGANLNEGFDYRHWTRPYPQRIDFV